MAIEGPLRELGIHDVFQLLDLSRKTGALRVTSDLRDDAGDVLFDGGKVIHASVRSNPTSIERILRQAGKITEADLAAAAAIQGDHIGLGDRLVQAGVITQRELEQQLHQAIESVVFELMSWREGFFSFEERAVKDVALDARIRISTESLLMEGARRIDEWSRIADKVPSLGVVPELAPVDDDRAPALDLLPHEWEVLMMIDGERDLRGIAGALGRSEFEIAKIAYGLISTGVVAVRQAPRISMPTARVVDPPDAAVLEARTALGAGRNEAALSAAREILEEDPTCTDARLIVARALIRLGQYDAAVGELRHAVQIDPLTPAVHLDLGFAAARVGDFGNARASWEHFQRLSPLSPEIPRVRAAVETLTRLTHLLEAHADG